MMKTEGKCRCGLRVWQQDGPGGDWMWSCWAPWHRTQYCDICGDYLHKNGWAYEMVRADSVAEEPVLTHTPEELAELYGTEEVLHPCEFCGKPFELEVYMWVCRGCYDNLKQWIQSHAEERETNA